MPATADALTYEDRKQQGRCTRTGCRRRASDASALCTRCHRIKRRLDREHVNRKRDERRAAGECIWCSGDRPSAATEGLTSCLACRIKRQRLRAADGGVGSAVGSDRATKIAAATSKDPDGRTRYRGQQKRGQQPKWQLNMQDLAHVSEDFETFSQGIRKLAEPETQQMHRTDREKAELAVAHVGDRMGRRVEDVLERLGHFKQRHGPRGGEK